MKEISIFMVALLAVVLSSCSTGDRSGRNSRPNILIIMADDMGFSDLACYGGEIQTPNIDRLAENGLRYRQFYNAGRCCPTRASLLTGLYQHQAGMGWMTAADLGSEGYRGELNSQCVTIAEVMKKAGYNTYMVGKWHVTADKNIEPGGDMSTWPLQRGFDRYYGPHNGGGSYFTTRWLNDGNERITPPEGYYLTDALSDTAASYIKSHPSSHPFFMYLAYTAPHFPLHARPTDIDRYRGEYREGWDHLRQQRYENMIRLGIIPPFVGLSEKMPDVPDWKGLSEEQKDEFDLRMAVYAAQVEVMDRGIGRVTAALEKKGLLENTVILFLSDNGGTAEFISRGNHDPELIGTDSTFESYRKPWATMSNTPFRWFKQYVHEGGISSPLVVHWPDGIRDKGVFRDQAGHVIDLMPTCLELAVVDYPDEYSGNSIIPHEGLSLVPSFNREETVHRTLFWEHQANRAIRIGDWKLVSVSRSNREPYTGRWELYDLKEDRSEGNDLSGEYPDRVTGMDSIWNAWATRCKVYPLDGRGWFERLEKN
jgi:arylsulfatase A-like enzyme